ncbi:PIG-L family deacetylase [Acidimicrobiaceae bacterium]|nr:PIG-L family deacetylase [Acidimicrobiaceae bacterium]
MELLDPTDVPERVLVVVAHPDDIDFGIAGTAAVLTAAGSQVTYALLTSGEAGIPDDMDRDELAAMREREQRAAAAVVGVTDVRFLGQPDGHLEANLELRKVISRVIRQVKPDVVITQSPERRYERIFASHPDHLACGEATISAIYPDARNPHAHVDLLTEGHGPHSVEWVWIVQGRDPNLSVNITDVMDKKVAALSSHTSQVEWIDDIDSLLRDWAAMTADRLGVADQAQYIEAFTKVQTH